MLYSYIQCTAAVPLHGKCFFTGISFWENKILLLFSLLLSPPAPNYFQVDGGQNLQNACVLAPRQECAHLLLTTKGTQIGFVVWRPGQERDSGGPKRSGNGKMFFLVPGPNVFSRAPDTNGELQSRSITIATFFSRARANIFFWGTRERDPGPGPDAKLQMKFASPKI